MRHEYETWYIYIFRPYSSLFIIMFSTWTSFHHYFSISYITICDIRSLSFPFLIDYSTLSLFHFEWWFFTRHCMEDCHILSPHSPHGQWFRDFNLRGCLVSEDSCYIRMWRGFDHLGMYFHGSSFIIDQSMRKKKQKQKQKIKRKKKCIVHYTVFHWAHVWMC